MWLPKPDPFLDADEPGVVDPSKRPSRLLRVTRPAPLILFKLQLGMLACHFVYR